MNEEEKDLISQSKLKPSKRLSQKLRQDAVKMSVKDGKIILDRSNPLHRMLMDDNCFRVPGSH